MLGFVSGDRSEGAVTRDGCTTHTTGRIIMAEGQLTIAGLRRVKLVNGREADGANNFTIQFHAAATQQAPA